MILNPPLRFSLISRSWTQYNLNDLLAIIVIAAVYAIAGKAGLSLAFVHASATAVWPPTGISLAVFLLLGYRFWPAIFLGAFLVNLTTEGTVATSLGIALGNTLEGLFGAYLVNRYARGISAFRSPDSIFRYAVLGGLVATAVSATIGVTTLVLGGFATLSNYIAIWLTWWLGDFGGALIIAPLIIHWGQNWRMTKENLSESVIIFVSLILVSLVVFTRFLNLSFTVYPLEIIFIPILIWLAFRRSQRAVATGVFLLSLIAISGTLEGFGPFVRENPNESLLSVQIFMTIVSLTVMVIAAVIQQRKEALLSLKSSEEKLSDAQEIAHMGSWEWDLGSDILTGSEEFYRIYETTPSEYQKSYGGFLERLNPKSRALVKESIEKSVKSHRPFSFYYPITIKKGLTKILHAKGKVFINDDGKPVKVAGTTQDVTVEKQTEESLKTKTRDLEVALGEIQNEAEVLEQAKAKEDAILSSIGEGLVVSDPKGKILLLNRTASEMIGWTIKEAVGRSVDEVFPIENDLGKRVPFSERPMQKALKLRGEYVLPANKTFYQVKRDGSKFPVVITAAPVKNKELLGVVSVFRDISREKEIDRMKTEFISVAAHQLRTPLGSMRWTMEMLLNGDMGKVSDPVHKAIQTAYEGNQRMITLVNDLLDVSRIDAQKVQDQPQQVDIEKVIGDVVEETKTEAREKSIVINLLAKADLPKIMIDPKRLREAIGNFISNAIKYNKPGGKVSVKAELTGGKMKISVTDAGMGIPQRDQGHIFSRFYRAENAIRRETSGSGLGLFVVASYVKGWGGEVGFESKEGKGSTFWFTLPLVPQQHTLDKRLLTVPVS